MKTLAQLKTSVYARGYEDDQAGRIAGFANDVVRELMNDHRYLFASDTEQVVAVNGTSTYTLPDDVQHISSVRFSNPSATHQPELNPVTADEMRELLNSDPAGTEYTDPLMWAQLSITTFSIYPSPTGGTLTVVFQRTFDEIDDDADELPVPDTMYDLMVLGVCQRLAERERQWEASDRFQGKFDTRLERIKSQLGLGQTQNAGRVGHSGDKQYGGY